jgi:hypothetical protein
MKTRKNDHPGYSCERTPWVLVTGVLTRNRRAIRGKRLAKWKQMA